MDISSINVYTQNVSSDSPGFIEGTIYKIGKIKIATLCCVGISPGCASRLVIPSDFRPITGTAPLRFWETGKDVGASSMTSYLETDGTLKIANSKSGAFYMLGIAIYI